jgi:hypothetical protein
MRFFPSIPFKIWSYFVNKSSKASLTNAAFDILVFLDKIDSFSCVSGYRKNPVAFCRSPHILGLPRFFLFLSLFPIVDVPLCFVTLLEDMGDYEMLINKMILITYKIIGAVKSPEKTSGDSIPPRELSDFIYNFDAKALKTEKPYCLRLEKGGKHPEEYGMVLSTRGVGQGSDTGWPRRYGPS